MREQKPWTNPLHHFQENQAQDHKLLEMSKILEDYMEHKFDVITDSEWFADLVEEKVQKILDEKVMERMDKLMGDKE